jgi:hypothetical protein
MGWISNLVAILDGSGRAGAESPRTGSASSRRWSQCGTRSAIRPWGIFRLSLLAEHRPISAATPSLTRLALRDHRLVLNGRGIGDWGEVVTSPHVARLVMLSRTMFAEGPWVVTNRSGG